MGDKNDIVLLGAQVKKKMATVFGPLVKRGLQDVHFYKVVF